MWSELSYVDDLAMCSADLILRLTYSLSAVDCEYLYVLYADSVLQSSDFKGDSVLSHRKSMLSTGTHSTL